MACHDVEVPDPMSDVVTARNAYRAALGRVTETRIELGRRIAQARETGITQDAIASELGLTRERVRRYQREYELAVAGQKPPSPAAR